MQANNYRLWIFALCLILLFAGNKLVSQSAFDSIKPGMPKHYFNTIITVDVYNKPQVNLDTTNRLNKKLKTYGIKQFALAFSVPLVTKEKRGTGADSNIIENSHLLLTGNFISLRPSFLGVPDHRLVKRGIGLRYIYNSGKKGLWFVDVAPFVTRDVSYRSPAYRRLASTIVYSYNSSDKLNLRVGVTKSFMWGNRFYLPFLGIRFGRLDKTHFSIQFPRSVSLNLPFNRNFLMSVYSRPQGGMYNFANTDSLYFKTEVKTFHFTRYEINSGIRFDVRIGSHFSFFIAAGLSTRNGVSFYSDAVNKSAGYYRRYFYTSQAPASGFGQFGLVLKLGKTRSIYNNTNLYDAIDLNSASGTNDGNRQIPVKEKVKPPKISNLESIQDLIDYNDL